MEIIMNNHKKGNKATNTSVFDMIPEEYRFEAYQRWMDYARYVLSYGNSGR